MRNIKFFVESAAIATFMLSSLTLAVEVGEMDRQDREKQWCSCVEASEGTDQEMSDCDAKFDEEEAFSYDKTCQGFHIPDDERN